MIEEYDFDHETLRSLCTHHVVSEISFWWVGRADGPRSARATIALHCESGVRPTRVAPEQVLAAAGTEPDAQFFGHLYLGLYFEALGMKNRALEHITIAAADRFQASGGYMHMVARVHLRSLTVK